MRILHDPRDALQGRGIPSSSNTGIGSGGIPQSSPDPTPRRATSVVSAPAKKDAAAAGTGRASTFVTGIGLSPARFLTQLRGKLGQRTLLAGR